MDDRGDEREGGTDAGESPEVPWRWWPATVDFSEVKQLIRTTKQNQRENYERDNVLGGVYYYHLSWEGLLFL